MVEGTVWGLWSLSCPPCWELPHLFFLFFQRRMNLPSHPTRPLMVLLASHHRGHPRGQMDLALTPETHPRMEAAISPVKQVTDP